MAVVLNQLKLHEKLILHKHANPHFAIGMQIEFIIPKILIVMSEYILFNLATCHEKTLRDI